MRDPAVPRRVTEELAHEERLQVALKQHPAVIVKPLAVVALSMLAWLWVATHIYDPGRFLDALSLVVLAALLWLGWRELDRNLNRIVVTDKRVFATTGIIIQSVPMMRISKVTDITYRRSIFGALLAYRTITIESAGQVQGLHNLTFVPFPVGTDALKAALFGGEPRRRRGQRRSKAYVARGADWLLGRDSSGAPVGQAYAPAAQSYAPADQADAPGDEGYAPGDEGYASADQAYPPQRQASAGASTSRGADGSRGPSTEELPANYGPADTVAIPVGTGADAPYPLPSAVRHHGAHHERPTGQRGRHRRVERTRYEDPDVPSWPPRERQ